MARHFLTAQAVQFLFACTLCLNLLSLLFNLLSQNSWIIGALANHFCSTLTSKWKGCSAIVPSCNDILLHNTYKVTTMKPYRYFENLQMNCFPCLFVCFYKTIFTGRVHLKRYTAERFHEASHIKGETVFNFS